MLSIMMYFLKKQHKLKVNMLLFAQVYLKIKNILKFI